MHAHWQCAQCAYQGAEAYLTPACQTTLMCYARSVLTFAAHMPPRRGDTGTARHPPMLAVWYIFAQQQWLVICTLWLSDQHLRNVELHAEHGEEACVQALS